MLTGCDLRVPGFATVDLTGQTVREVVARGKHLFHRIGELSLHTPPQDGGRLAALPTGRALGAPVVPGAGGADDRGACSRSGSSSASPRCSAPPTRTASSGHLGPDLLGPDWDAGEAERRLAANIATPVYVALLDQRNLAGIGNVYANELCFLRGLLPTRLMADVSDVAALVDLARRLLLANADRWNRSTMADAGTRPAHLGLRARGPSVPQVRNAVARGRPRPRPGRGAPRGVVPDCQT